VSVQSQYQGKLNSGALKPDSAQRRVIEHLEELNLQLSGRSEPSFLKRLFAKPTRLPRGLYIHGEVGRGKTMLMDLFFDSVVNVPKRRIHFHAFMQEVHRSRSTYKGENVIGHIADNMGVKLLCLDEMQIVDIADAMIIGRLLDAMHERGICWVTTSNLPPEDLYKDGLNRDLFLPFIAKLRNQLDIISLDSPTDYRLGRVQSRDTYLWPATAENRIAFNALWNDLTDDAAGRPRKLDVLGRTLLVPKSAHSCAAFTFNELCSAALGPADYLVICSNFRTVFVSGIRKLTSSERNEAKRFVLMIDTFYDAHIRLIALADCAPEDIAAKGQHSFEFKRTVSRLKEMQSASWWT
jgi:cell division protein ZapE